MESVTANVERFSGFAETYDTARPTPPTAIVDLLTRFIRMPRPELVVDVGCGTGLSTRIWTDRAVSVVGIDPNTDMRRRAQAIQTAPTISYRDGLSTATGLADACADIVTISQALHWMEPRETFAEMARILRPGGVLAAYDCDWPPAITAEVSAAYETFDRRSRAIGQAKKCSPKVKHWEKAEHLKRMRESGCFAVVFESMVHSVEVGTAHRIVQLALSQGDTQACLRAGLTAEEIGLTELEQMTRSLMGEESLPWHFSYRLRLGLKS
jgi:ubiquinone/menaquinone biosynthesis C-methylase UbiE